MVRPKRKMSHTRVMVGNIPSFYWPEKINVHIDQKHQDDLHRALAEIAESLGCEPARDDSST